MEVLISEICSEHNSKKQKELIIQFLELGYFTYPIINSLLCEFKITPQELTKKKPLPDGNAALLNLTEVQLSHHEARRLAKIDILADLIQSRKIFSEKSGNRSRRSLYNSPLKNNKSYKSILESEPEIPLSIPLNQEMQSQRLIESQHKKLERLLKVSENIKHIKFEEEKKKVFWSKELEEKLEKIKQTSLVIEEEREKKKQKNESIRYSKLQKKYEVLEK